MKKRFNGMRFLAATFAVFKKGGEEMPLKINILEDIQIPEQSLVSKRQIRNALQYYTKRRTYLEKCIEGAPRCDLAGNPVGAVTKEEADYAAGILANRAAKAAKAAAKAEESQELAA